MLHLPRLLLTDEFSTLVLAHTLCETVASLQESIEKAIVNREGKKVLCGRSTNFNKELQFVQRRRGSCACMCGSTQLTVWYARVAWCTITVVQLYPHSTGVQLVACLFSWVVAIEL